MAAKDLLSGRMSGCEEALLRLQAAFPKQQDLTNHADQGNGPGRLKPAFFTFLTGFASRLKCIHRFGPPGAKSRYFFWQLWGSPDQVGC